MRGVDVRPKEDMWRNFIANSVNIVLKFCQQQLHGMFSSKHFLQRVMAKEAKQVHWPVMTCLCPPSLFSPTPSSIFPPSPSVSLPLPCPPSLPHHPPSSPFISSLSGTPENVQAVLTAKALPLLIRGMDGPTVF